MYVSAETLTTETVWVITWGLIVQHLLCIINTVIPRGTSKAGSYYTNDI